MKKVHLIYVELDHVCMCIIWQMIEHYAKFHFIWYVIEDQLDAKCKTKTSSWQHMKNILKLKSKDAEN